MRHAPYPITQRAPILTSPTSVAFGATTAEGSMIGPWLPLFSSIGTPLAHFVSLARIRRHPWLCPRPGYLLARLGVEHWLGVPNKFALGFQLASYRHRVPSNRAFKVRKLLLDEFRKHRELDRLGWQDRNDRLGNLLVLLCRNGHRLLPANSFEGDSFLDSCSCDLRRLPGRLADHHFTPLALCPLLHFAA